MSEPHRSTLAMNRSGEGPWLSEGTDRPSGWTKDAVEYNTVMRTSSGIPVATLESMQGMNITFGGGIVYLTQGDFTDRLEVAADEAWKYTGLWASAWANEFRRVGRMCVYRDGSIAAPS